MPDVPTADEIATIADPRLRLLQAGARHLVDEGFDVLAGGLTPDAVTATAGRSRRVFYDHFDNKHDFTAELFELYLDFDLDSVLGPEFESAFRELFYGARGDIYAAIADITGALFPASTVATEPLVHAIAWSTAATDPATRERLAEYYDNVDVMYHGIIRQALAAWRQQLRPPWTIEMLAVTLRALSDGAYARNTIAPGTVDAEAFALQVAALVTAIIQPEGEPDRPFGDELRRISRLNQVRWREEEDPAVQVHSRQRVLDAVVPAMRASPGRLPSFEELADTAGVSVERIRDTFDSAPAVVSTAIVEGLPALGREADFDLETASFPVDTVLRRHLIRLARWTDANPELAFAALTMPVEQEANGAPDAPLSLLRRAGRVTRHILDVGKERGEIRDNADTGGVALLSTHAILARSAMTQGTPELIADWLIATLLDGVRPH